jgi:TolB-like protein
LEPRDFHVLLHLIDHAPNFVSTRALLRRAWRNKIVGDNVLHQSIGRLRRVLGDNAKKPIYIQTLAKMGYQFIAPVVPLSPVDDYTEELNPIAVMPFRDYSREANDPYVIDGLSFGICHQLMQSGAQVVSLDQAARIQRRGFTDLEVGGRVGARTVLGGSLIVSGDRLRVTSNLSDVETERQLWSAKHDFATGQILDLHTLLSEAIVKGIYERLCGAKGPLASPAANQTDFYSSQPQLSF